MSEPLVSIVIPVYNGSDYLREAIESALGQTYANREVIVVNDGSNDDGRTREVALSFGDRIRYLEKENGGVATALNKGIEEARGKYISWLSHDDTYRKDKLERQVAALEKMEQEGKRAVVYTAFAMMDERSKVFSNFDLPDVPPSQFYSALLCNKVFVSAFKMVPFGLHGCTLLVPKKAFEEMGPFDSKLPTTQDYELWFKMLGSYDFVKLDGYSVNSRIHKGQGTYVLRKERVEEVEDLYRRAFNRYDPKSDRYDLDLPRVMLALKVMRRMKAYTAVKQTLREQGFSLRSWAYSVRAALNTKTLMKAKVAFRYFVRKVKIKLNRGTPPAVD
jgi:glycosyltransferase involved in cell wall biosynthesis